MYEYPRGINPVRVMGAEMNVDEPFERSRRGTCSGLWVVARNTNSKRGIGSATAGECTRPVRGEDISKIAKENHMRQLEI